MAELSGDCSASNNEEGFNEWMNCWGSSGSSLFLSTPFDAMFICVGAMLAVTDLIQKCVAECAFRWVSGVHGDFDLGGLLVSLCCCVILLLSSVTLVSPLH